MKDQSAECDIESEANEGIAGEFVQEGHRHSHAALEVGVGPKSDQKWRERCCDCHVVAELLLVRDEVPGTDKQHADDEANYCAKSGATTQVSEIVCAI